MVTGAGGSIGSELCRQILACQPSTLLLIEFSEAALYAIHQELGRTADRRSDGRRRPAGAAARLGLRLGADARASSQPGGRAPSIMRPPTSMCRWSSTIRPRASGTTCSARSPSPPPRASGRRRLRLHQHRQGGAPDQRDGRDASGSPSWCCRRWPRPAPDDALLDGPLRQRAGLERLGRAAVPRADPRRRAESRSPTPRSPATS